MKRFPCHFQIKGFINSKNLQIHSFIQLTLLSLVLCASDKSIHCPLFALKNVVFILGMVICQYAKFTCSYLFLPKVTVLTWVRAWNAHLCRNHQPLCVRLLTAFLFLNFWVLGPNYKNTSYTDFIVPWFEKCKILSMKHTWSDTCILQLSNNLNFNLKMLLLSPHFFHINFKKWKWSPASEQQAQLQSLQESL